MAQTARKYLIMICIALLVVTMTAGSVQASTVNGVNRIVSVGNDYRGYPRTILTIAEEADTLDSFIAGETFELRLPEGVKWYEEEATGLASYHNEDIICQNCIIDVKLYGDKLIGITFIEADPVALSRLEIPLVFEVDDYLGDIEVTIDSIDSNVSGGRYLFAQVPYKLVPVPSPDPVPEPIPHPAQQQVVFTIDSPLYTVNGKLQPGMDVAPYIMDGRTYLPVRFVAHSLGIGDQDIQWDDRSHQVTIRQGDQTVIIQIGSKTLIHNGRVFAMDVAPEIQQERTMLPVAPIVEAFGGSVLWDPAGHLVTITTVAKGTSQSA